MHGRVELKDLDQDERVALAALIEYVVEADTNVSEGEIEEIAEVVAALGVETYQALADEVADRFADEQALRDFLVTLRRQDARELIYGTVLEAATRDAIGDREAALLDWLAKTWKVRVEFGDPR